MSQQKRQVSTQTLVLSAIFMALVLLFTFATKIPMPSGHGYIHLGDGAVFLGVLMLGRREGTMAAAFGSALADVLGGYAFYAPITLFAKGGMAFLMATILLRREKRMAGMEASAEKEASSGQAGGSGKGSAYILRVLAMGAGGLFMVLVYYLAEWILYGNPLVPLAGLPLNILQFAVGMAAALALEAALRKTPLGRQFVFRR